MQRILVLLLLVNAALLLVAVSAHAPRAAAGSAGANGASNGDVNGDGRRDVSDAVYYLEWLFLGGREPVALAEGRGLTERDAEILSLLSVVESDDGRGGKVKTLRVTGANLQVVNGLGATNGNPADPVGGEPAANGAGNIIVGYLEPRPLLDGEPGEGRTGSHNVIVGGFHSFTSHGCLIAGAGNTASAPYASVTGGRLNVASGPYASVTGGAVNVASGPGCSVSGGGRNVASVASNAQEGYNSVSGGFQNTAQGAYASVTGGSTNSAYDVYTSVTGGFYNAATQYGASITGGSNNTAKGDLSSVSGGMGNLASGFASIVTGGGGPSWTPEAGNHAKGAFSSVSGGSANIAAGDGSSVSGGVAVEVDGANEWSSGYDGG